jgi:hypothetical protein
MRGHERYSAISMLTFAVLGAAYRLLYFATPLRMEVQAKPRRGLFTRPDRLSRLCCGSDPARE